MRPYYDDGHGIVLYHGDCREVLEAQHFQECHGGDPIAVVSDPPYGMKWDTVTTRFSGGNNPAQRTAGRNDARTVKNDDRPFDPSPWLDYEDVILFGANHYAQRLPVGTTLVWVKRNDAAFGSFLSDAEIAWQKGGHGVYCFRDLSMNAETLTRAHPTQKPIPLMTWCLNRVDAAAIVLDPFAGSGTTLVAAKNLGRRAIGIELDERYAEIAAERLRQEVLAL